MIDVSAYRDRPIGVMGLGRSGLATARALAASGALVRAWDDGAAARDAAAAEGIPVVDLAAGGLDGLDTLVLSPGIPHSFPQPHPVAAAAQAAGCRIVCDVELLGQSQPEAQFFGITGTNGKSTTTALVGHILARAGRSIAVGGNLGPPVLDMPPLGSDGTYVLEMSSYQLERTFSIAFDVAVLLNISADHLDRHGGWHGYVAAKRRIFDGQGAGDTAIVGVDDDEGLAVCGLLRSAGSVQVVPVSGDSVLSAGVHAANGILTDARDAEPTTICKLNGHRTLPGIHNRQNAAAATAVALSAGIDRAVIADAIADFPGLPHRQELVAEKGGIAFVNDSKATNADAAEKALGCYDRIYWIAGGEAKAEGIAPLRGLFGRVAHAYLIGESANAFAATLGDAVPHTVSGSLERALDAAADAARADAAANPVVLLSPAAASFDQFPSFEARGDLFRQRARALTEGWA